jgi:hypothetical protein
MPSQNRFLFKRYRVVRYEFSIKTTHSLGFPKRDIIYAQGQSDLLLNLEVSNSHFQVIENLLAFVLFQL